MTEQKNRRLRPQSKSVCAEHSISRVAMALGSWNREKEKVIGDKAVQEWRGGEWTAHRAPAGRQAVLEGPGEETAVGQVPRPVSRQGWECREEQLLLEKGQCSRGSSKALNALRKGKEASAPGARRWDLRGPGPPDPCRPAVATPEVSAPAPGGVLKSRDLSQQALIQPAHVFNLNHVVFKNYF